MKETTNNKNVNTMTDKEIQALVIKKAEANIEKLVAGDPVTWKVMLKYLGEALGKAVLGEVFKSLFKSGVDYKNLFRNLLKDIDRIITQRIEEAFIQQSINKMGSVQDAMLDYLNQPSSERLADIEQGSRDLINSFESYNHRCYKEYLLAVPLRVFALEEYLKLGRSEEDNIKRVLNEAINHIRKLDGQWRALSDNRFSVKWDSNYMPDPFPGGVINIVEGDLQKNGYFVGSHWVEMNGQRVSNLYSWSDLRRNSYRNAVRAANAELIRQRNLGYQRDVIEEYVNPSSDAIVQWEKRIQELS